MQLGATSLINFKSSYCPSCEHALQQEYDAYDVKEDAGFDSFIKDVKAAKQDVNLLSCATGFLAAYATLRNGAKLVGMARSASAIGAEAISKFGVKVASKIKKSIDVEKANKAIHKFFQKATNEIPISTPNQKWQNKFCDVVDVVVGQKDGASKGQKIIETMNKNGVYMNGRSLFDHAVAIIPTLFAADKISDATESAIDKKNIEQSALKNLNIYKNMADVVVNEILA